MWIIHRTLWYSLLQIIKKTPNVILFWKKRLPCGRPDFKFLIAHIKFYSHQWAGKWISTTLLILAGFVEAEKLWLKFHPNLRKSSVKKFYSLNEFCWDKIYNIDNTRYLTPNCLGYPFHELMKYDQCSLSIE